MIHPDLEIRKISDQIGYGLFATKLIPKGTITYIRDELEIIIPANDRRLKDSRYRPIIEKYAFVNSKGEHVLSWDFAKYVNHSCTPNSLTTGYDFEIAIKDILPGEQLTDDYGLFNMDETMVCLCGSPQCRGSINKKDFVKLISSWDNAILSALECYNFVAQPLAIFMDAETSRQLDNFFKDPLQYKSVKNVKRIKHPKRIKNIKQV